MTAVGCEPTAVLTMSGSDCLYMLALVMSELWEMIRTADMIVNYHQSNALAPRNGK